MQKKSKPPIDNTNPYSAAIARHRESELNIKLMHMSLAINIWLSCTTLVLIIFVIYFGWKSVNTPIAVVATDNGRIIPVPSLNEPVYNKAAIIDYGANHIRQDFTLDFVHYREQINARQDSFSREGFISYYNALINSNILDSIKKKKMNLSVLTSAGVVVSEGTLSNGIYAWKLQYPITIKLDGQTTSMRPQEFVLIMTVSRADPRLKKGGLEVIQIITKEPGR